MGHYARTNVKKNYAECSRKSVRHGRDSSFTVGRSIDKATEASAAGYAIEQRN